MGRSRATPPALLLLLLLLAAACGPAPAAACTTYIIASAASTDGSVLIARNDDGEGAVSPNTLVYHPARSHAAPFKANLNKLALMLPAPGLAYFSLPAGPLADPAKGTNTTGEAAGWNEAGVAVSATESIYNSAAALEADPLNEEDGIIEDAIPSLLLPQATSARHGAKLLGELVTRHGAGEAFGVLIADGEEAWYLETASGHHWLAQRVPAEAFFISANQGRFQEADLSDNATTLASPGLLDFAAAAGLWDREGGRPFNFFEAFMRDGVHDVNYSYPRVCLLQGLWAGFCPGSAAGCSPSAAADESGAGPALKHCVDMTRQPVFLHPRPHKLSANDIKAAMRNHWEGSAHDPYTNKNPNETWRPIALLRTGMGHVTRLRPLAGGLPDGLSVITYTAMSTPKLSPFIPLYKGLPGDALPPELTAAQEGRPDGTSIFWRARRLQALVFQDWPSLAPRAAQAIADFEAALERTAMPEMEARYAAASAAGDEAAATRELVAFTAKVLADAGELLDRLAAQAAEQLGLPAVPEEERWLEWIKEAAETYAFEPTSDPPGPSLALAGDALALAGVAAAGGGPKGSGAGGDAALSARPAAAVQ